MRRRHVLQTAGSALATAFAGCVTSVVNTPSTSGEADLTTNRKSPGGGTVRVSLTLENRGGDPRSGRVEIVHVGTPACRYSTPQCGKPSRRTVALGSEFDLAAGETRRFDTVEMALEADDNAVDTYAVEVETDAETSALVGLEAGAAATVGRDAASDYPWRVAARTYEVRGRLTAEGVHVSLRATQ